MSCQLAIDKKHILAPDAVCSRVAKTKMFMLTGRNSRIDDILMLGRK